MTKPMLLAEEKKNVRHAMFWQIITRAVGFIKDVYILKLFGLTTSLDLFITSISFYSFFSNVLGGAIGTAFIPSYFRFLKINESKSEQKRFVTSGFITTLILGFGFTLLASASLGFFIHSAMGKNIPIDFCLRPLAFITISNFGTSFLGSLLNAKGIVKTPLIISIFSSVILILALTLLPRDLNTLCWMTVGAGIFEVFCLSFQCRNDLNLRLSNLRIPLKWFRSLVLDSALLASGLLFMSSTEPIDRFMALSLGEGSASSVDYGSRITMGILAILIGVSRAIYYPGIAEAVHQLHRQNFIRLLKRLYVQSFFLGLLLMGVVYLFSATLVRLVYKTTAAGQFEIDAIQRMLSFQIPFYLSAMIGVFALLSMRATKYLIGIGFLNCITNIIGNYFLMNRMGPSGIALSTSLVYFQSWILILLSLIVVFRSKDFRTGFPT